MDGSERNAISKAIESQLTIEVEQLYRWMESEDLEVLAASLEIVEQHWNLIQPEPSFINVHRAALRYFRRSFTEGRDGVWCETPYAAGHHARYWFELLWQQQNSEPLARSAVAEFKQMLRLLFLNGSVELRTCIETSCLEHLFERKEIAEYFADWRHHPKMREAYDLCLEWGKAHLRKGL